MAEIDKAELKKLLIKSKKEPVNCATATDKDGAALIMLHKIKQPRALVKELEKEYGSLKNPRFGSAFVDVDDNPKLVILTLNKASPGIARKMKKTLKGTGFTKVRVMLEDGSVDEAVEEEEDEEQDEDEIVRFRPNNNDDTQTPSTKENESNEQEAQDQPVAQDAAPPPPPEQAPSIDVNGLTKRLTDLVKRMIQVVTSDPSRQNELKALAVAAQNALKANDPQTPKLVDDFEAALGNGTSDGQTPPPADPAKQAALAASPKIWNDTISVVSTGVGKLKDAILKDFADEAPEVVADIRKNLDRIDQVTARFDKTLADLLDGVNAATDDAARKAGLAKAKAVLAEHIKYAATEPLIGMIDQNPFGVSPEIKKTLVANLTQLANAIR